MSATAQHERSDIRSARRAPTSRQVDLLLGVAVGIAVISGITAWGIGTGWARVATVVHAVAGLSLVVLAPAKILGSVRRGLKRRRPDRWLSIMLAAAVVATIVLGLLHATGLWFGVGYWSALWTHTTLGFIVLALVGSHIVSRPARPRMTDLDRRAVLGMTAATGVAATAYAGQEIVVRATGLAGRDRRFTGSHEVASFDPPAMPTVQWFDDKAPSTPPESWSLIIAGQPVRIDDLAAQATPIEADLDCTGGWWSRQSWDAVALRELLPTGAGRSIKVSSATGYSRLYSTDDADHLYLAVGYSGLPLRRGHGAPVRLIAPGRRGPWWVKWVTRVELTDRPAWLQFPFPLS